MSAIAFWRGSQPDAVALQLKTRKKRPVMKSRLVRPWSSTSVVIIMSVVGSWA